jgi:hypothetical protein
MKDGPTLTFERHQTAFARMASTSKKTLPELWREEARICFGGSGSMPGVAGITPPYGEGKLQNARSAEAHARAKVAADIYGLYGTPGDAYDAIQEKAPGQAGPFWYLLQHKDVAGASDVLRAATGSIIHPFDGGVHHRRNFRKGKKGGRGFRFYVSDPKNLKAYVQLEQELIWWLASGWAEPLQALGARLPTGVKRHPAPGHLTVTINESVISIEASNDVRYAREIADMERRIMTVMNDWRVARLDRAWDFYLAKLARESGLKKV